MPNMPSVATCGLGFSYFLLLPPLVSVFVLPILVVTSFFTRICSGAQGEGMGCAQKVCREKSIYEAGGRRRLRRRSPRSGSRSDYEAGRWRKTKGLHSEKASERVS
jgi:hypothetical protein